MDTGNYRAHRYAKVDFLELKRLETHTSKGTQELLARINRQVCQKTGMLTHLTRRLSDTHFRAAMSGVSGFEGLRHSERG